MNYFSETLQHIRQRFYRHPRPKLVDYSILIFRFLWETTCIKFSALFTSGMDAVYSTNKLYCSHDF